ncbi:transducin/WD40 repeat-like superfamily protein, partial [Tanacetum coccineum]
MVEIYDAGHQYENECSLRVYLQSIKYFSTLALMVQELFDEDVYHYPCDGGMHMMEFADPEVARRHAVGRLPFHHSGPILESEQEHAMLIVGLDTSSHDHLEHHVIVKNSYGKSWGNKGYSKVAFEAADLKVQADADAAKARAKAAKARARAAKRKAKD